MCPAYFSVVLLAKQQTAFALSQSLVLSLSVLFLGVLGALVVHFSGKVNLNVVP